jgi:hypothetical protein
MNCPHDTTTEQWMYCSGSSFKLSHSVVGAVGTYRGQRGYSWQSSLALLCHKLYSLTVWADHACLIGTVAHYLDISEPLTVMNSIKGTNVNERNFTKRWGEISIFTWEVNKIGYNVIISKNIGLQKYAVLICEGKESHQNPLLYRGFQWKCPCKAPVFRFTNAISRF